MTADSVQSLCQRLVAEVERVIVGKRAAIELVVIALLCEGHVLIEDVPGVGKTMLARAVATSLGGAFRRLQCTPDLLPNDVVGVSVFNQRSSDFEFRPGPVFANILLADEINRATPRTQSALLEAMAERQVSLDGVVRPLPRPFVVLATQNPIEYEGTFPLPEAQLDRFLLRLRMGYPAPDDERLVLRNLQHEHPIEAVTPVTTPEAVLAAARSITDVHIEDSVVEYLLAIVQATREHRDVALGASPRASLGLFRAAQARAALVGREYVLPDDIKALAPAVIAHRLIVRPESALRGRTSDQVTAAILEAVDPPIATRAGAR
jgi:MoxR-like ATPase